MEPNPVSGRSGLQTRLMLKSQGLSYQLILQAGNLASSQPEQRLRDYESGKTFWGVYYLFLPEEMNRSGSTNPGV